MRHIFFKMALEMFKMSVAKEGYVVLTPVIAHIILTPGSNK